MGAGNNTNSGATYLKLKAKTSDTDGTPYFGRNEKKGDSWEIVEKFSWVSGHLTEIKHDTYPYEGQTKHKVVMMLVDTDGTKTQVEANYNNLTYNILNSLASFKPDYIRIEVWLGKAKITGGKAGKQYPSAAIKVEGMERIGWKYTYDQQPQPVKEVYKGNTITDDSKVIQFWTDVIEKEIAPNLKGNVPAQASGKIQPNVAAGKAGDEKREPAGYVPDQTDDLPFRHTMNYSSEI